MRVFGKNCGLGILAVMTGASGTRAQATPSQPAPTPAAASATYALGDLPGPIESLQDLENTGKMLFKLADANNGNRLFQKKSAGADKDGALSKAEYDKRIVEPANVVFGILDANGDGQIAPSELDQVGRVSSSQARRLRGPESTAPNPPPSRVMSSPGPHPR